MRLLRYGALVALVLTFAGCGGSDGSALSAGATALPEAAAGSGGLLDFGGGIEAMGRDSVTVDGRSFLVDQQTEIQRDGRPVSLASLRLGDYAVIKARLRRDGALVAAEIKVRTETRTEIKFTGGVESVSAPDLVVAGRRVTTTSATTYTGLGSSLRDVQVGYLVTVTGLVGADDRVQAEKIRIESKG
jgi:hypothetical protein